MCKPVTSMELELTKEQGEKLFHPTMKKSTVEKLDPEALEFSAWILHDLEEAMSRIKWYAELNQEAFLKACSNGLTVILNALR